MITLLMLVEAWLKSRKLKWKCDPENSMLLIDGVDPLDIRIYVDKDRVTYTPMTFYTNPRTANIAAIDPAFFQKLENVLRHEACWSNWGKCIILLIEGMLVVWGPMLCVVVPWIIDRIDDVAAWYARLKAEYFPRQEL